MNRNYGRDPAEPFNDQWVPDITCVPDLMTGAEMISDPGIKKPVGVGKKAYP
jgi:hypothetical protein